MNAKLFRCNVWNWVARVTVSYSPVQKRFFYKDVHGCQEKFRVVAKRTEDVGHAATQLSFLRVRSDEAGHLRGQSERHQLRVWQKLQQWKKALFA